MRPLLCYIAIAIALSIPQQLFGQRAAIKFQETMHNFDVVEETGGTVSHNFVFTNTGGAHLLVMDVITNCGCTQADYPLEPIAPGEQDTITITFDPLGRVGEFAKEIVVKTNAKKKKSRLHIKGVVVPTR